MGELRKSASLVTLVTGGGVLLALLSNLVVAAAFGAGAEMDAYLAATTLPTFIVTIFSLSLSATFLPLLAEYKQAEPDEEWRFASSAFNAIALLLAAFCVLGVAVADPVMALLSPGFSEQDAARAADLLQWLLPVTILNVVNALLAGICYAKRRMLAPLLFRITGPAATMLAVWLFADRMGVASIVLASFCAALAQTILSAVSVCRIPGFRYHPPVIKLHPGVWRLFRLAAPLLASMVIYKAVPFFDRYVASTLPVGSISVLGYAAKLSGLIHPLIVSGIALSFYPLMSEFSARNDFAGLRDSLARSIRMVLFVALPVAALLGSFGRPIVVFFLARGRFSLDSALLTHQVLILMLAALPAIVVGTITAQGFYALKDTKTVTLLGIVETSLYVLLCLSLLPAMGIFSIPTAQVAYYTLSAAASIHLLSRRMKHDLFGEIAPAFARQAGALALGVSAAWPLSALLPESLFASVLGIAVGSVVYFLASRFLMRSREAETLWAMIRGVFGAGRARAS